MDGARCVPNRLECWRATTLFPETLSASSDVISAEPQTTKKSEACARINIIPNIVTHALVGVSQITVSRHDQNQGKLHPNEEKPNSRALCSNFSAISGSPTAVTKRVNASNCDRCSFVVEVLNSFLTSNLRFGAPAEPFHSPRNFKNKNTAQPNGLRFLVQLNWMKRTKLRSVEIPSLLFNA